MVEKQWDACSLPLHSSLDLDLDDIVSWQAIAGTWKDLAHSWHHLTKILQDLVSLIVL